MLEHQLYVYSSLHNAARRIRVREDGTCLVELATSPPAPRLTLIGTSGNIAGFLSRDESCFILWDVANGVEARRVLFNPSDSYITDSMMCSFGHTQQGAVKIVCVGRVGMICRVKIHSSAPEAGPVTGGMVGLDGLFEEDQSWSDWHTLEGCPLFLPDRCQQPRLVGNQLYWFGSLGNHDEYLIVAINLNTDAVTFVIPPLPSTPVILGVSNGVLTATDSQISSEDDDVDIVTIRALADNLQFVTLVQLQFPCRPSPYPYLPLCFLPNLHMVLLVDEVFSDRVVMLEVPEHMQHVIYDLITIYESQTTLTVSPLPLQV